MSELNEQLPKLPEHFGSIEYFDKEENRIRWQAGYTADQMRMYAIDAIAATPAPQAAPSGKWTASDALRYAARVIELYDDATMQGDYMLSSTDCAGILTALADMPMFAAVTQAAPSEPVAYVRRHQDGTLTDELLPAARIEPVRKASGAWLPLGLIAPLAAQQSPADARDAIIRDVCELDYSGDEFDHEDMLSVLRADLCRILARHIAAATTSTEGRDA